MRYIIDIPTETYENTRFYGLHLNPRDKEALKKALTQAKVCKTGKWIAMSDTDGVYWICSECGEEIPRISHYDPQFDLFPRLESINKTNFCPNCGADMRGEEDAER